MEPLMFNRLSVSRSQNVTDQLESVYEDIEPFLKKTSDIKQLAAYIQSLEDQVEDLYQEKEEAILSFEGVHSISDLVKLAKGMEEQLKSLYQEKENN
jgi:microsomal dipeptidase-like Zn-dependent dipeptidase